MEEQRLNSSHTVISYAVFCLKKKKKQTYSTQHYYTNSPRNSHIYYEHSVSPNVRTTCTPSHVLLLACSRRPPRRPPSPPRPSSAPPPAAPPTPPPPPARRPHRPGPE